MPGGEVPREVHWAILPRPALSLFALTETLLWSWSTWRTFAMDAHIDTSRPAPSRAAPFDWTILLPLALAQFIASYAASNMNVAINSIAQDLNTDVQGVQTAITLFTLTMAALMIPGSKLTDIWGRKFCFELGLIVYGLGALIAALAPEIGRAS